MAPSQAVGYAGPAVWVLAVLLAGYPGAAGKAVSDWTKESETRIAGDSAPAQRQAVAGSRKPGQKHVKGHPLNDILHGEDLTAQLKPLDAHALNDPGHLRQHHASVLKMARRRSITDEEFELLRKQLGDHMREYRKAIERKRNFEKNKDRVPKERREFLEHSIAEQARALHHKFYTMKMRVITHSKSDKPFEELRQMMAGPAFSDEDRANFEKEIVEHQKERDDFTALQRKRNSELMRPEIKRQLSPQIYTEKKRRFREHVKAKQIGFDSRFEALKRKVMAHAGEL